LLFDSELLRGTDLAHHMKDYSFFSYEADEALHLSESEREIVLDCLHKIKEELMHPIDQHSRTLIVNNIELLLNYCVRFYDHQFLIRSNVNKDVLTHFESLLEDYFATSKSQHLGLPSVQYFADQLHLSPNYFGDLIKKETNKSAQEHIQTKLIDIAKNKVLDTSRTLNEIADELGFKYPQHFSRFFKEKVGCSPTEYRTLV
jgi:AraC-like DNA-binding protein